MTAATAPSTSGGGGGAGTGFLFGNIDRRGRLDEDYLDEEAKDNIDNVGTTVTDRDKDLAEITREAGRGRKAGDLEGEEKYDDDDDAPADDRVDYFDEQDDAEEQLERARMAQVALALPKRAAADNGEDENYDDDDDDDDDDEAPSAVPVAGAFSAVPVSASKLSASAALPDGTLGKGATHTVAVPQSADKESKGKKSGSVSVEDDGAAALQRRLLLEAREGKDIHKAQPVILDDESSLRPLKFSQVFSEPLKKIDMRFAKPRTFGVQVTNEPPNMATVSDDFLALDTPPPVPSFNPMSYFLSKDRQKIEMVRASKVSIAGDSNNAKRSDDVMSEYSDDEDAAMPLDEGKEPLREVPSSVHDLVQQVPWEDDICWLDDGSDTDQSLEEEEEPCNDQGPNKIDVDSDSDEDIWEDGKQSNTSQPTVGATPISGLSVPLSQSAEAVNSVPLSKPVLASSRPTLPSLVSKPITLTSKLQPRTCDPNTSPNNTELPAKKSHHKPPLPPGKSTVPKKGANGVVNGKRASSNAKNITLEEPEKKEDLKIESTECVVQDRQPSKFIQKVLRPNRLLYKGDWLFDIMWDDCGDDVTLALQKRMERAVRFATLILDPSDPNLIFETIPHESVRVAEPKTDTNVHNKAITPSPSSRLPLTDPFNISNDFYYSNGNATNPLKVDRRSLLRGLHNAPPAVKCQTTRNVPTEEQLLSWHKPKIHADFITNEPFELLPFRRRRPKGGSAQIAGQIPKKRNELFCSSKDAYRVALFEYSIEKQPCILPIPGMASRILTYSRKKSASDAAQALKNAAGTPEADTVFMAPEEPPPLHAGDINADGPSLSVVESHIYAAPCQRVDVPTTDFLVTRRGRKMQVREIDTVVSVGVTEPKVEVMAPNTERFKKYARDRVSLYIIREFVKQQKKEVGDGGIRPTPALDKEQIFREFSRRRTFPETAVIKQLKELAKYQNGRYTLVLEPSKGFVARETELLRTLTAEETAAFDAMDSGWELLLHHGINIFTHPTSQCNIIQVGERTGLLAGPAVGAFIKNQLLQTPWYRTQVITAAQRAQKKEMAQALSLARIVNDLREGGNVMESRLLSLSAGDLQNVLMNHFRIHSRRVPDDIEKRRSMVREYTLKKNKGSDVMDYQQIINNIITRHRNSGQRGNASNAAQTSAAHSSAHVIPLNVQRKALEKGIVDQLPSEIERTNAGGNSEAAAVAMGDDAFGKKRSIPGVQLNKSSNINRPTKRPKTSKKSTASQPKQLKTVDEANDLELLQKLAKPNATPNRASSKPKPRPPPKVSQESKNPAPPAEKSTNIVQAGLRSGLPKSAAPVTSKGPSSPHNAEGTGTDKKKSVTKKRPTRLRVTKKVTDEKGVKVAQVTYVTDPVEIERMLAEKQEKALKKKSSDKSRSSAGKEEGTGGGGEGKVKISFNLQKLAQVGKSGVKKKPSSSSAERKKSSSSKKRPREPDEDDAPKASSSIRKVGEKNQIGKIRINTKQMKKEKEEAAQKRVKSQFSQDDYRARKSSKGMTSRKKRNGGIQLNSILEQIERMVRGTEGYVKSSVPVMKIERLRPGEKPPAGTAANNLAAPVNTALDFTQPVDVKHVPRYAQVVKKPMDLGRMRQKCKKMEYQTSKDFLDDMSQIAKNARAFNNRPDVQWVVQHAELLLEVAQEQVADKAEEIAIAEEAIQRERARGSKPKSETRN